MDLRLQQQRASIFCSRGSINLQVREGEAEEDDDEDQILIVFGGRSWLLGPQIQIACANSLVAAAMQKIVLVVSILTLIGVVFAQSYWQG